MKNMEHKVDFCVVGGGMAGVCAALAAARNGIKTSIVHDRPVFGGNASSEIRMHVCGADRGSIPNVRETGIVEEIRLENQRRNPQQSYSMWDTLLLEKIMQEKNIRYFLNSSCLDARIQDDRIQSIKAWQLTTETWHMIEAKNFADCSGDGILAPLSGALYRIGREGRDEYGESIAPEKADNKTMGMTCLYEARDVGKPCPYEPPPWAYKFKTDAELPYGTTYGQKWFKSGHWWVELGGNRDSIHDTEVLRDELLKIVFGVWDHIKNHGDHGAENWALDWIGFLPGKRESRRFIGEHVLTQNDIRAKGQFEDMVAYGGWPMDDHHPEGFWSVKIDQPSTIFHEAPSPYGIPFRSLYSKNISNLMFAGRNISATHAAISSTRVMATCAVMGEAIGTAAAIAVNRQITIRDIQKKHIAELQQTLLANDCYLPKIAQQMPQLTMQATLTASSGDPAPLRDGFNRTIGDNQHCWEGRLDDTVEYKWTVPQKISRVTLVFDSNLAKPILFSHMQQYDQNIMLIPPAELVRDFRLEIHRNGQWVVWKSVTGNYQRLFKIACPVTTDCFRARFQATWGKNHFKVFAFYVE